MNRFGFRLRSLVAGLVSPICFAAAAHAATCPDILALVDAGLPADVGQSVIMHDLLNPPLPAESASSAFTVDQIEKAVKAHGFASEAGECCSGKKCVFRNNLGEVIRLKAERGAAVFLSHARSSELDENTVPQSEAVDSTREAMRVVGIPSGEIDALRLRVADIEETMADVPGRTTPPSVTRRSEVLVRFARQINGTPVEGSKVGAAIAPSGEIARLRLTWPPFAVTPGLNEVDTLSRREVLDMVAKALSELNACGSLSRVSSEIRYIPLAWVEGMGDADREPRTEHERHPAHAFEYVPALKVSAKPIEQAEDSGVSQDAGLILYMPLLRSGEAATPPVIR